MNGIDSSITQDLTEQMETFCAHAQRLCARPMSSEEKTLLIDYYREINDLVEAVRKVLNSSLPP